MSGRAMSEQAIINSPAISGVIPLNQIAVGKPGGFLQQMVHIGHSADPLTIWNMVSPSAVCANNQLGHRLFRKEPPLVSANVWQGCLLWEIRFLLTVQQAQVCHQRTGLPQMSLTDSSHRQSFRSFIWFTDHSECGYHECCVWQSTGTQFCTEPGCWGLSITATRRQNIRNRKLTKTSLTPVSRWDTPSALLVKRWFAFRCFVQSKWPDWVAVAWCRIQTIFYIIWSGMFMSVWLNVMV